jgi:hypothetical protein
MLLFANWGQVAQLVVALAALAVASHFAFPSMFMNEFFSAGATLFYLLVLLVFVSIGLLVNSFWRQEKSSYFYFKGKKGLNFAWLEAIVDEDSKAMPQRVYLDTRDIDIQRPTHLNALEPFVDLRVHILNISVYTLHYSLHRKLLVYGMNFIMLSLSFL